MKKKNLFIFLPVVLFAVCFIPVSQQKNILIKSSFLNVYRLLSDPAEWKRWRTDLRQASGQDSAGLIIQKKPGTFIITNTNFDITVGFTGSLFKVNDRSGNKTINYSFAVLPDKSMKKTLVTVDQKTTLIQYLINASTFADTHVAELKNFLETDSLLYGCSIFKTRVPEANLLVIRKTVLVKQRFAEAARILATLKTYIKTNNIRQMQPLIAQFLAKGQDSTQVNVGFFIDREVKSQGEVTFMRMPKGGPLYSAKFHGSFNKRQFIYDGLKQYFADHRYQSAILPFETYLDDKLPASDTDTVNVQVNFSTYF